MAKTAAASGLGQLKEKICKQFGQGAIMQGETIVEVSVIPTGIASVDIALGCGGLPRGRIIEVFGPESSGKTTFTLECIANCQSHFFPDRDRHGVAAFIDAEHALDPSWAAKIGVNMDNLLLSQPDCGEEAIEIAKMCAESGEVDLVVVDSVAAMIPKAELEGNLEDSHIGVQARLMSKGLRTLKGICHKHDCTIIFINQLRQKIGVMFGNPETTTGGMALKFYASVRIDVRKVATVKPEGKSDGKGNDGDIGIRTKAKIVKNKVAPPFRIGEFDIIFGRYHGGMELYGVDTLGSIFDEAVDRKIVDKSGSWFSYKDIRLGMGRVAALAALRADADLLGTIREALYQNLVTHSVAEETGAADEPTDED